MASGTEDFLHKLERIFLRSEIRRTQSSGATLNEVLRMGRQRREVLGSPSSYGRQLERSEYIINTQRWKLIEGAFTLISDKYISKYPGFAIIILGSNIFGGAVIREMMDNFPNKGNVSDIDYMLTSNSSSPIEWSDRDYFSREFEDALSQVAESMGYLDWSSIGECHLYNSHGLVATNIFDKEYDEIKQLINIRQIDIVLAYLYPSIPPGVNKQNREALLNFLRQLSQRSHKDWERIVSSLRSELKKLSTVKIKHFGSAFEDAIVLGKNTQKSGVPLRDTNLVRDVTSRESSRMPTSNLVRLLESTDSRFDLKKFLLRLISR